MMRAAAPTADVLCLLRSYVSIPQQNKTLQLLAIESLATFASLCSYFLVLAPNAVHVDSLSLFVLQAAS